MNNASTYTLRSVADSGVRRTAAARPENARALAGLLLAAMVAALVVIAEHFISTWADGHLFLAWVALWAVVFASTALLAGPARQLAQRGMQGLDRWARARAQARAEARLWDLAKSDPRVMAELKQAKARASQAVADAETALAPLGMDNGLALPRQSYLERLAADYRQRRPLHYL